MSKNKKTKKKTKKIPIMFYANLIIKNHKRVMGKLTSVIDPRGL